MQHAAWARPARGRRARGASRSAPTATARRHGVGGTALEPSAPEALGALIVSHGPVATASRRRSSSVLLRPRGPASQRRPRLPVRVPRHEQHRVVAATVPSTDGSTVVDRGGEELRGTGRRAQHDEVGRALGRDQHVARDARQARERRPRRRPRRRGSCRRPPGTAYTDAPSDLATFTAPSSSRSRESVACATAAVVGARPGAPGHRDLVVLEQVDDAMERGARPPRAGRGHRAPSRIEGRGGVEQGVGLLRSARAAARAGSCWGARR